MKVVDLAVKDFCGYPLNDLLKLSEYLNLSPDTTIVDIATAVHTSKAPLPTGAGGSKPTPQNVKLSAKLKFQHAILSGYPSLIINAFNEVKQVIDNVGEVSWWNLAFGGIINKLPIGTLRKIIDQMLLHKYYGKSFAAQIEKRGYDNKSTKSTLGHIILSSMINTGITYNGDWFCAVSVLISDLQRDKFELNWEQACE